MDLLCEILLKEDGIEHVTSSFCFYGNGLAEWTMSNAQSAGNFHWKISNGKLLWKPSEDAQHWNEFGTANDSERIVRIISGVLAERVLLE